MKKKISFPIIQIIRFENTDMIITSTVTGGGNASNEGIIEAGTQERHHSSIWD